jgi:hypothetical protein
MPARPGVPLGIGRRAPLPHASAAGVVRFERSLATAVARSDRGFRPFRGRPNRLESRLHVRAPSASPVAFDYGDAVGVCGGVPRRRRAGTEGAVHRRPEWRFVSVCLALRCGWVHRAWLPREERRVVAVDGDLDSLASKPITAAPLIATPVRRRSPSRAGWEYLERRRPCGLWGRDGIADRFGI